ncbi:diacylglycerol kinase family protein [Phenylobacterium sp.]|uniref:diacylglycerol/lipid kinase family protein n=1 Tax=Phenylobacterium sp. TaxID=1871053 RepID=UPI0027374716|nr:diacylglycerol kinase family protein [Phenylobacterium sp.]MDP3660299.1 diacylglycerol kinase family protein [Phenylobacterium sp.]
MTSTTITKPAAGERFDLKAARIGVLINTSSGSCDVGAESDLQALLAEAGLKAEQTWCGGGDEVDAALAEAGKHSLEVLIVLGGDGTIRAAAETCQSGGTRLIPLPGGTMNVLPKALYGARPWREALKDTLADCVVQAVHGGAVGDHRFYIAGIFGGPTKMADAREAVREGDLAGAMEKGVAAIRESFTSTGVEYAFANHSGTAEAVAVICPLISRGLDDDEETLEAAAIKVESAPDALRLAINAAFRDWREDPTVVLAKTRSIEMSCDRSIPALLDGERFTLGHTASVSFVPDAFEALRPRETEGDA